MFVFALFLFFLYDSGLLITYIFNIYILLFRLIKYTVIESKREWQVHCSVADQFGRRIWSSSKRVEWTSKAKWFIPIRGRASSMSISPRTRWCTFVGRTGQMESSKMYVTIVLYHIFSLSIIHYWLYRLFFRTLWFFPMMLRSNELRNAQPVAFFSWDSRVPIRSSSFGCRYKEKLILTKKFDKIFNICFLIFFKFLVF